MKNKVYLKKIILFNILIFIILTSIFLYINNREYYSYINNYNNKINSIIINIKDKYPNASDSEIMDIITNDNNKNKNILKNYGYDIETESIIIDNNKKYYNYLFIKLSIFIILELTIILIYLNYNNRIDKNIKKITKVIDEINKKNYELKIEDFTEDELSILKDAIYKTTLTLKESAENSIKDKINIKKSLEDISHQIRTPLTSILINIDNIIDNTSTKSEQKEIILRKIKREALNINTLVENLLKLSRFDVNTIKFTRNNYLLKDLISDSLESVLPLADLNNIKININGNDKEYLFCDKMWEKEALGNILKNAIEHSYKNDIININYETNNVYSKIEIINNGATISKKDLKHIFERFYKGENSSSNSFGIGLSLAKVIIEKDNGKISVSSINNKTIFTIKYYK